MIQPHSSRQKGGSQTHASAKATVQLSDSKLLRRGNLNCKTFQKYINDKYYKLNEPLWMMFKDANKYENMTGTYPCINAALRPSAYFQGRNVVWQWKNESLYNMFLFHDDYHDLRVVK